MHLDYITLATNKPTNAKIKAVEVLRNVTTYMYIHVDKNPFANVYIPAFNEGPPYSYTTAPLSVLHIYITNKGMSEHTRLPCIFPPRKIIYGIPEKYYS